MRARALLTIPFLTILGCEASRPDPLGLARVEQATVEGGNADDVFGQPSLTVGTEPAIPSQATTHFPAGLATDVAPFPGSNALVWIADREAHRVIGFDPLSSPKAAWWVLGQVSFEERTPNSGGAVSAATLNSPTAVAFYRNNSLAVADAGNHRVLLGQPMSGMPWNVNAVFGQANAFDTAERNKGGAITADTLADPSGVAFDPVETVRLLVSDTGNHRILIFSPITTGGEPISTTAKVCIGQDDCTQGLPNRGGTVSRSTLNEPRGIATYNVIGDPLRGFYVADTGNHRVLHFPVHATLPDLVYGQEDDFNTAIPSKGGPSARSLRSPTGVVVDRDGSLWIVDTGHHRVLHFPKGKTTADRVLGQPDMTSAAPAVSANATQLKAPEGVAVTPTDVFVADTAFSRVLRFRRTCDPSMCDDGNPCTNDSCGASGCINAMTTFSLECRGHTCSKNECLPCSASAKCQPGYQCYGGVCAIPCGTETGCPSGKCVDGFCCDRACDGPCESCNRPGSYGRCTPSEGAPPTGRSCSSSSECGGRCNGKDGSRCYDARAGDSCGVRACIDGVSIAPGECRADGTCDSKKEACAPYACDVPGCRTTCRFDHDCSKDATCVSGVCVFGPGVTAAGGCAIGRAPDIKLALAAMALALVGSRRRRR